jgi:integrase
LHNQPMASHVQKRASGRYRARFRAEDGREHSKTFDRKREAEQYLDAVNSQLHRGEWISPDDRRTTLADYAGRWVELQQWRPQSRDRQVSLLALHVLPTFGDRKLGSIRPSEVRAWMAGLPSAPTANASLRLLSSILKAATHDRLIPHSPCDGVKALSQDPTLGTPLTVAEVEGLAEGITVELAAAVRVAAMTGLRQGELFGLSEDRVRWLERSIVVDRQLVSVTGGTRFGPPKTARSKRTVPVPDAVLELLSEQIRRYGPGSDGLVFHQNSAPWSRSRAGARIAKVGGEWHQLRHHCASVLIAQGLPVTAVAAVLGHSPQECLRTYAAWFPSEDEAIRGAVVRAWTSAPALPQVASRATSRGSALP